MRFRGWLLSLAWRYSRYTQDLICEGVESCGFAEAKKLEDVRVNAILKEMRKKASLSSRIYIFTIRFRSFDEISPSMARLFLPNIFILLLPDYALEWDDDALRGVIAHEVAHVHLGHVAPGPELNEQEYLEREALTDLKAAEWVGHSAMIAALREVKKQLPHFSPSERPELEKILTDRVMLLDVDMTLKKLKSRPA